MKEEYQYSFMNAMLCDMVSIGKAPFPDFYVSKVRKYAFASSFYIITGKLSLRMVFLNFE